jgi:hypothetical protein
LAVSTDVSQEVGIDVAYWTQLEAAEYFSGRQLLPGSTPYAVRYAGHQFQHFVPQLGDGRAISLGQLRTPDGLVELQLKGAGRTPFSRFGDGFAVLRSSIREFLCSEGALSVYALWW